MLNLLLLLTVGALAVAHFVLRVRVERLERRLADLLPRQAGVGAAADPAEPGGSTPAPPEAELAAAVAGAPGREIRIDGGPDSAPATAPPRERETIGGVFERLVAGRLLVWLGGIALVVAAIFLIRYSIGLVTPEVRMIAAALFGLILLGAGEYAHRARFFVGDLRVAQALVGAGLAVLYAATYGAHVLHGLIGTGTASLLMLVVTAAALALSLRHGPATAVMGLAGGFLTPLLVGDPDADALTLLGYLALLDVAIFVIAWRKRWTWLAAAGVVLSFAWSLAVISGPAADALLAGAFVVLLSISASLVQPGGGRELILIQPLAVGLVLLAALVSRADLGASAWILFAILAVASMILGAIRDQFRLAPLLALVLALLLLAVRAALPDDPLVPAVALGATLLFGVGGLAVAAWKDRLAWHAGAALGFAAPILILRALQPDTISRPAWGAAMLVLALGPAALVWLGRRRAGPEAPANLGLLAAGAASAALLVGAAWDWLAPAFVPAGWLVAALLIGLAARQLKDFALTTVAALVAALAATHAVWLVPELSVAGVTGIIGDPVLVGDLPRAIPALQILALPALLLVALRLILPPLPLGARHAIPGVAGLFAVAAAYVLFKQAFGLAGDEDFAARGLVERTIITQALFALGWLLGAGHVRLPRLEPDLVRLGGTLLTAFAAARLIWFDLVAHNPVWRAQWVGELPIFNLVTAEYLAGAIWLHLARRRADAATRSGLWLAAFFVALVGGAMLLVRQGFHGAWLDAPNTTLGEFYSYSLAGLVVAIGLLVAGIRLPDKALRLAGLVLLTATIIKVFLIDARELEGIWRVLSFLGLGVALIGVGRLYGPVLRAERPAGDEKSDG